MKTFQSGLAGLALVVLSAVSWSDLSVGLPFYGSTGHRYDIDLPRCEPAAARRYATADLRPGWLASAGMCAGAVLLAHATA